MERMQPRNKCCSGGSLVRFVLISSSFLLYLFTFWKTGNIKRCEKHDINSTFLYISRDIQTTMTGLQYKTINDAVLIDSNYILRHVKQLFNIWVMTLRKSFFCVHVAAIGRVTFKVPQLPPWAVFHSCCCSSNCWLWRTVSQITRPNYNN